MGNPLEVWRSIRRRRLAAHDQPDPISRQYPVGNGVQCPAFLPYGFLLSAVVAKRLPQQILVVISTSVLLEIAQYLLAVGRSDITDILLNTLGGVIGIVAYYLLTRLFGKHARTAVSIAFVLIAAFELYASVSFILFGAVWLGFMMFKI